MKSHIVIDGNAFYEVDDTCMYEKVREQGKPEKKEETEEKRCRQEKQGDDRKKRKIR